jgi:hypothetical protein
MKSALHDLSKDAKLSMNMGQLIPIGITEALPGDKIDHSTLALIRTQPLLAPLMHEVYADIHHWFVPIRLLWDDFEDFITGGPNGLDTSVYPTIETDGSATYGVGSLADYLGIAPTATHQFVSALPFRAYALIYNNWYRDQDLNAESTFSSASGPDITTSRSLVNACWEKDYFTSARPWPQKGPDVTLPLSGNAPVNGIGLNGTSTISNPLTVRQTSGSASYDHAASSSTIFVDVDSTNTTTSKPEIYADMTNVNSATIEDIRLASALQIFAEHMAQYGSRFTERMQAAFGVKPQDSRLQIPEYLGGGRQKIQFSEVLQTAEGTDPVGQMAGHGIAAPRSNKYRRFIPEYGFIVTMLVVRPKTQYIQGLSKMWSRPTKEDWFQPELQFLGQEPIYNKEIKADHSSPNGVFGYQDRYDSYRRQESTVHGEFRTTLNFWHMARDFGVTNPALNATFVTSTPTTRVYPATNASQLYVSVKHNIRARRRLIQHAKPRLF